MQSVRTAISIEPVVTPATPKDVLGLTADEEIIAYRTCEAVVLLCAAFDRRRILCHAEKERTARLRAALIGCSDPKPLHPEILRSGHAAEAERLWVKVQPAGQWAAIIARCAVAQTIAHIYLGKGIARQGKTQRRVFRGALISQWSQEERGVVDVVHPELEGLRDTEPPAVVRRDLNLESADIAIARCAREAAGHGIEVKPPRQGCAVGKPHAIAQRISETGIGEGILGHAKAKGRIFIGTLIGNRAQNERALVHGDQRLDLCRGEILFIVEADAFDLEAFGNEPIPDRQLIRG